MSALPQTVDADSPLAPAWDPLALDPGTMRELGHRTVDMLVDMLVDPETPCLQRATPAEMERRIPATQPDAPRGFGELVEQLRDDVFPFMSRLDHPGYMAFIPACGTFPAALGDFMAAVLNPYVGTWMEAAGPSRLELVVLDWFRSWIGYPTGASGVLVSGGSAANTTALACARETRLGGRDSRAVIYLGDQAHSSMTRAWRLLGFAPEQVRDVGSRGDGRMCPRALARAIDADRAAGLRPLFVGAVAGATNTGAIDPLAEISEVCQDRGVWLHVDGAYGAFAALTERGRAALAGIELADSVTMDPHKWLYQPFDCGSLLVRDGDLLRRAFEIAPDYLKDAVPESGEVNLADRGLELSRGARALKIWLSLSYFGVGAFRDTIDRCLDTVELAEAFVRNEPDLELMSGASLGIICFRWRGRLGASEAEIERDNAALVRAFEESGQGLVSSTRVNGRYAIRLCVMNHTTSADHALGTLGWFAVAGARCVAPRRRFERLTPVA